MKKYVALLASLALLAPTTLLALTEDEEDILAFEKMFPPGEPDEADFWRNDRLLVSATGSQKPVRLAPSVASVITAADIEAIGATTLDDVLETVPGLHVYFHQERIIFQRNVGALGMELAHDRNQPILIEIIRTVLVSGVVLVIVGSH